MLDDGTMAVTMQNSPRHLQIKLLVAGSSITDSFLVGLRCSMGLLVSIRLKSGSGNCTCLWTWAVEAEAALRPLGRPD